MSSIFFWLSPKYTVPILVYHSLDYKQGSFFVNPENFTKQMGYIKKNGYEVISSTDGEEGVKMAVQEKPDLILADVIMSGIDGLEVCRRLRALPGVEAAKSTRA